MDGYFFSRFISPTYLSVFANLIMLRYYVISLLMWPKLFVRLKNKISCCISEKNTQNRTLLVTWSQILLDKNTTSFQRQSDVTL